MKYFNTKTKEYPVSINTIRKLYPSISIPENAPEVKEFKSVSLTKVPAYDSELQIITEGSPLLIEGNYFQNWIVSNIPSEQLQAKNNQAVDSLKESIINLTQKRLDLFASTRGYDGVNASAKYKTITADDLVGLPQAEQDLILKFNTESKYLATVTARTWAKLYIILGEVESGTRVLPSGFEDIESELPFLEWPV